MAGWPRPVYPGDFIAAKFYDLSPPDNVLTVNGTPKMVTRLAVPRGVLAPGHLYQIWFGPFSYQSFNPNPQYMTENHTVMELTAFRRAGLQQPREMLSRPIKMIVPFVDESRDFQTVPMFHAFYSPPFDAPHVFETMVIAREGATNVNRLSLDLTLFGVSAVAEPDGFRTVNDLP